MPKIGFVVQNETQRENFLRLANDLVESGVDRNGIIFITLDAVTHLNGGRDIHGFSVRTVPVKTEKSLYLMTGASRMIWLFRNAKQIERLVDDIETLVVGNDGAVQRIFLKTVRRRAGKTAILVDGLLFPFGRSLMKRLHFHCRMAIFRAMDELGFGYMAPSIVGLSAVDQIFVMTESVKTVLKLNGCRSPISVIALPRHADLAKAVKYSRGNLDYSFNLLYVTSAFAWHGAMDEAKRQQEDLADIVELARKRPDMRLAIRVHPREAIDFYNKLELPANVTLRASSIDLALDLAAARCVVTARSTVAWEARYVGVPVYLYVRNFCPPDPESPLGSLHFPQIYDLEPLLQFPYKALDSMTEEENVGYESVLRFLRANC